MAFLMWSKHLWMSDSSTLSCTFVLSWLMCQLVIKLYQTTEKTELKFWGWRRPEVIQEETLAYYWWQHHKQRSILRLVRPTNRSGMHCQQHLHHNLFHTKLHWSLKHFQKGQCHSRLLYRIGFQHCKELSQSWHTVQVLRKRRMYSKYWARRFLR